VYDQGLINSVLGSKQGILYIDNLKFHK